MGLFAKLKQAQDRVKELEAELEKARKSGTTRTQSGSSETRQRTESA